MQSAQHATSSRKGTRSAQGRCGHVIQVDHGPGPVQSILQRQARRELNVTADAPGEDLMHLPMPFRSPEPFPGKECPVLCLLFWQGPGPVPSLFGRRDGLQPRRLKQAESLGEMSHPHSARHLSGLERFAAR